MAVAEYAPGSQKRHDAAMIEHANTQYGKAVARLRELEAEMAAAFRMLHDAISGQQEAGNGAAVPAMSSPAASAWCAYLESLRAGDVSRPKGSDPEWPHPPILDWQDP